MNKITQKELKEVIHYNKNTGLFTWARSNSNAVKVGDVAGGVTNGYVRITVNNSCYLAHRLAWLYVYGEFPKKEIDHINHIKTDNSIKNLRDVIHSTNSKNAKMSTRNTTGVVGIRKCNKSDKWTALITIGGESICLGTFMKRDDAIEARRLAEGFYGFHENHGNNLSQKVSHISIDKKYIKHKICIDFASEICEAYATGEFTQREIAKRTNIPLTRINRILTNK